MTHEFFKWAKDDDARSTYSLTSSHYNQGKDGRKQRDDREAGYNAKKPKGSPNPPRAKRGMVSFPTPVHNALLRAQCLLRPNGLGDWRMDGTSTFHEHFPTAAEEHYCKTFIVEKVNAKEVQMGLPKSARSRICTHLRKQCKHCPAWLTKAWGVVGPSTMHQVQTSQPALTPRTRAPPVEEAPAAPDDAEPDLDDLYGGSDDGGGSDRE